MDTEIEPTCPKCGVLLCPKCNSHTHSGYGLLGGGIGTYTHCLEETCDYFEKTQDPQS
jgi:hypothetical protein